MGVAHWWGEQFALRLAFLWRAELCLAVRCAAIAAARCGSATSRWLAASRHWTTRRHRAGRARPDEAPDVQAPRRAPHAEAVVHEQLDARATRIREEVAVVRLRCAEDLHHACQQPLGAGAHVDGLGCQLHSYRASMRTIEAAHASRPRTRSPHLLATSPRRSSRHAAVRCGCLARAQARRAKAATRGQKMARSSACSQSRRPARRHRRQTASSPPRSPSAAGDWR